MLRIVCGEEVVATNQQHHQEEENVVPDDVMIEKEEEIAKPRKKLHHATSRYDNDIQTLEKEYGVLENSNIVIDLQKLLKIVPRERRRIDAYRGLLKFLKDTRKCIITITSRKTKI